jgi:hypothetical protein
MLLDEVIIGDIDIFEERRSKRCDAAGMNYYILLKAIGASRLKDIPDLLSRVIEAQYWKKWRWIGNDFEAVSIDAYVSAHPPKGLGARVELIERLLADKPEVLKLFRRARRGEDALKTDTKDRESQRPHEQPKTVYNGKSAGNSSAAFLRRLRKDRPDSTPACSPANSHRRPVWSKPGIASLENHGSSRSGAAPTAGMSGDGSRRYPHH